MAIATFGVVALDCPDAEALAGFYAEVLGGKVVRKLDHWVDVVDSQGKQLLACQEVAGYTPPQWPGQERPQQLHLDLDVELERIDQAEREVLALGARLVQSDEGVRNFRVYLDPAGHPFCLCFS